MLIRREWEVKVGQVIKSHIYALLLRCYALTHTCTAAMPPPSHTCTIAMPSHTRTTTSSPPHTQVQLLRPPHTYCVGESEEDNEDAAKLAKHRSQEYDATLSTPQQLQIQELRSHTESPCYLYDLRLLLFYARYLCVPLLSTICLNCTIDSVPL